VLFEEKEKLGGGVAMQRSTCSHALTTAALRHIMSYQEIKASTGKLWARN